MLSKIVQILVVLGIATTLYGWLRYQKTQQSNTILSLESAAALPQDQVYVLDLSHENLQRFPDQLAQYDALKKLILDGYLPVSTQQVLKDVYQSYAYEQTSDSILIARYHKRNKGNQISFIPPTIKQFYNLEYLSIQNNQLSNLPTEIGLLTELQVALFSGNKLQQIPDNWSNLKVLHTLDLSNNQLSQLPNSLSQLNALKNLSLSRNQLSTFLPKEAHVLHHLETLVLDNNQLEYFPNILLELPALRSLELAHNALTTLPNNLEALKNLEWLDLKGNHFSPEEQARIRAALPRTRIVFE